MSEERPKLQLQLDDAVAEGHYANLVIVNHGENEFVLDFAFLQPGSARARVRTRVVSSPRHTKRLIQVLQRNLERYEERFGVLEIGDEAEPVVH